MIFVLYYVFSVLLGVATSWYLKKYDHRSFYQMPIFMGLLGAGPLALFFISITLLTEFIGKKL